MNNYKSVKAFSSHQIISNRSKFIGYVSPVAGEREAIEFIKTISAKHFDATHNVYAYAVGENCRRFSDDGEPSGSAGMPILNIINHLNLTNCVIVVTRYFGGVLLGTGGLSRAYTKAAVKAIRTAGVIQVLLCASCSLKCTYSQYGKISALIAQNNGKTEEVRFYEEIEIDCLIPADYYYEFQKNLNEITSGSVQILLNGEKYLEFEISDI